MKASNILGLNARAHLSYAHNKNRDKLIANSKIRSKKLLKKSEISVPEIYKVFKKPQDIFKFDWQSLSGSFALKPSKGLGGDGIIVVKKKSKDGEAWIGTNRKKYTAEDLQLHTLDILEGAYSMSNAADVAYVEEYVARHKSFRKYAYRGTPDIRIIVFNQVPLMAMLRLPTKDSGGRANLHQGAIGVGIDIATGITTKAVWYGEEIKFKPGTKRKLHGLKIPAWGKVLDLSVKCQSVLSLGYMGVDIVLHPDKGPMVLELNAQPGFQIQLCNDAGLKKRIEKVEDLDVASPEHGVRVAKILFSEKFSDRVRLEEGIKTLNPIEKVRIYGFKNGKKRVIQARVDTGAKRSSIDRELAKELNLLNQDNIIHRKKYAYKSASGRQVRPVVGLTMRVAKRKIRTGVSVANRSRLSTPLLIGRDDMEGFLVKPHHEDLPASR